MGRGPPGARENRSGLAKVLRVASGSRTLAPFNGMLCLYVCHSSHSCILFFPFPLHLTTLWLLSTHDHPPSTLPQRLAAAALPPCMARLTRAASAPLATSSSEWLCLAPSSLPSGCSLLVSFSCPPRLCSYEALQRPVMH